LKAFVIEHAGLPGTARSTRIS